jgi:hypothetical protein
MPELIYRLSVAAGLESFRPELEHVCRFLDDCYHLRRTADAGRVLHYGEGVPDGAVAVPAVLFPAGVRVDDRGMHLDRTAAAPMVRSGGLLPPASPATGSQLPYDALGLMFFLLSRIEERDHPDLDRYKRFPVSSALIPPQNGRLHPFADQAAHDLATALMNGTEPEPRTCYEVLFTHDVDILRGYHRPFEPLRNAMGDILKRGSPGIALRRLNDAYFAGEPWSSMRRLMDLSERHGIKSRFYFMGPSDDPMDSPYVIRLPKLLREVTDEIDRRGHVLGFHPGYRTFDNPAEWMRQRSGVEAVIGSPLREGRHHVLRYDAATTPRIWSDAGMTMDCTLAYPETVGFRSGTCRAHGAYDPVSRRTLPLKQLSTAVMEFGLFGGKYRDLSRDQALSDATWAIETCRKYSGAFVLLFHSGQTEKRLWDWVQDVLDVAVGTRSVH